MRGILLENYSWCDAETRLAPESLIVIPLGAQLKEHGPHLPLNTDWLTAEWLKARVVAAAEVIMLPTIAWHFFPAFVDYPGSVTLSFETAKQLVIEICESIASFGPQRFYVINTGVSTRRPLQAAAEALAAKKILLQFTDIAKAGSESIQRIEQQHFGTHADEIETSMMLVLAPERVDMTLATIDGYPGAGPLRRTPAKDGVLSVSGILGDARLATAEKGKIILEAMLADILNDIEALRALQLPTQTSANAR